VCHSYSAECIQGMSCGCFSYASSYSSNYWYLFCHVLHICWNYQHHYYENVVLLLLFMLCKIWCLSNLFELWNHLSSLNHLSACANHNCTQLSLLLRLGMCPWSTTHCMRKGQSRVWSMCLELLWCFFTSPWLWSFIVVVWRMWFYGILVAERN